MKEKRPQLETLRADLSALEHRVAELERRLQVAEPAPADELGRRKTARKKGLLRADYGTAKAFYSDIATDISEGGVRIATSRRHEAGLVLNMLFEVPNADLPLKVKGEIVWVREMGEERGSAQYAVGIRFLPMDGWTQRTLKEFVASLPAEKRGAAFEEKNKDKWLAKIEKAGL